MRWSWRSPATATATRAPPTATCSSRPAGRPTRTRSGSSAPATILRTSAEARQIVRACLALDVVVSDRLDSAAWVGVLGAMLDLMERVEKLEAGR